MRIDYYKAFPAGAAALVELEKALHEGPLEQSVIELVKIRVSQINGCGYCLAMHNRDARAAGESQVRLDTVAAWREVPFFDERERAALAWAESLTNLPETGAPDSDYALLEEVFDPEEIAALSFAIVAINGWNRLAVGHHVDVTTLTGIEFPPSR